MKQVVRVESKEHFIKMQDCKNIEPSHNYSIAINGNGKIAKIGPCQ